MPSEITKLLEDADEDAEAEHVVNVINNALRLVISETRHLAAVLYAPGDAKIDNGNGRRLQQTLDLMQVPGGNLMAGSIELAEPEQDRWVAASL